MAHPLARDARLQILPWEHDPNDLESAGQIALKARLVNEAGASFDDTAFIAQTAQIFTSSLRVGARSWIAGHAIVRGEIVFGDDCTVNPYACISGRVRFGNGVRIASLASVVGFNHGFDDADIPVFRQPVTSKGIIVGDDVWIGANAVILDGVIIGSGAVIAAGAVVSRDVPEMAIVAGVPGKVVRLRGEAPGLRRSRRADTIQALTRIGTRMKAQWRDVLSAHHGPDGYLSPEADGTRRASTRHLCDAIEIAAAFDAAPAGCEAAKMTAALQSLQDPDSGYFPDPSHPPSPDRPVREDYRALYNILAVGYALENLGAHPLYPVSAVELPPAELVGWLRGLPWRSNAWAAGDRVDAIGTALYFNARYFQSQSARECLFGWLTMSADRATGLWGHPTPTEGLLQPVNGFYRLTRGTYAQFGLPLPYPDAAARSVLMHYRQNDGFVGRSYNACNLLDVVHPLWLCLQQTDQPRKQAEEIAEAVILRAEQRWHDGGGFSFADGQPPGLQGTEMWLATIHTAAAILNIAGDLPFRPKGIHRLEPAGFGY